MVNIYSSKFILIYSLILAFILGSVFGSFLNCIADRINNHQKWWSGRSVCDNCSHSLSLLDLFPIFSYIFLKGKCRYCGNKISIKYLISELLLGSLFVVYLLIYGTIDLLLIRDLGLICILYGLSICDLNTYEIPDGFIIFGIIWWLIFFIFDYSLNILIDSLLGALVISGMLFLLSLIMDKLLKKESLGGGDIKLFFMLGLYLGLLGNFFNLILSCLIGIIFVFFRKASKIPFGPSISIATYISLAYGVVFINWYLSSPLIYVM